jgi:VanZ family protein
MAPAASPERRQGSRLDFRTLVWAICLLSAFVATHTPPPEKPAPMILNDKFLHFMGFCAIGVVTVWRIISPGSRLSGARFMGWLAFLLAYAALDETTQQLVGRDCELGDWMADAMGAIVGMAICVMSARFRWAEPA